MYCHIESPWRSRIGRSAARRRVIRANRAARSSRVMKRPQRLTIISTCLRYAVAYHCAAAKPDPVDPDAAPPDAVLDVVANPINLPRWAPQFAPAIRSHNQLWIINCDGEEIYIRVRVDREHGTVDLLAANQPTRGAFTRVVPNGPGSEYLFTLFFSDGTEETAIRDQMAIFDGELKAVRELCETPDRARC